MLLQTDRCAFCARLLSLAHRFRDCRCLWTGWWKFPKSWRWRKRSSSRRYPVFSWLHAGACARRQQKSIVSVISHFIKSGLYVHCIPVYPGSFKLVYWNFTFARHFLFSLDCLDCFSVSLPVAFLARYQPKVSISVIPWGDLNVPTFSSGTWNRYCY